MAETTFLDNFFVLNNRGGGNSRGNNRGKNRGQSDDGNGSPDDADGNDDAQNGGGQSSPSGQGRQVPQSQEKGDKSGGEIEVVYTAMSDANDDEIGEKITGQVMPGYRYKNFHYLKFTSATDLFFFLNKQTKKWNQHNQRWWQFIKDFNQDAIKKKDTKWIDSPMPKSIDELEKIRNFRHMAIYDEVYKEMSKRLKVLKKVKRTETIDQKKVGFTDHEIGIFSFDRAATGLKKMRAEDGTIKIVSSVKKVFAVHETKPNQKQFIRLYVNVQNSAAHSDSMPILYTGIYTTILAQELELAGFDVEVIGVIGTADFKGKFYATLTTFKKVGKKLNVNDFLLMTADAAFTRYTGYKIMISTYNFFGHNANESRQGSIHFDWHSKELYRELNDKTRFKIMPLVNTKAELIQRVDRVVNDVKNGKF